jgi:uncharacterized protein (TIGR03435 family)
LAGTTRPGDSRLVAAANTPQSDGSSLTTALNEQLGLKFESTRAPVDVVVIDSVDALVAD